MRMIFLQIAQHANYLGAVEVSVYEVRDLDRPNKGKRSRDQEHLFYVCVVY